MLSVGFSRHRISLGFWGLSTVSIKYIDNKIKQWNNWAVLVDTKDEEPLNQTWARESRPVGNSRCFTDWTWPLHFPPLSVVVQGLQWARSSGASSRKQPSLPWSSRDSLVFIIYLDVRILMGYSELIWRTPTCVKSFRVLCHPKTSPNKSSYRCSHFVGCLALESARGPGLWSSWGPTSPWRLFKASGGGSGFRHSE